MARLDAGEAREEYLDRLPEDEQARVIRTCEKLGPGPTDADWLIAEAALTAAERIEKAARTSNTDDLKPMLETLIGLLKTHTAEPSTVGALRTPAAYALGIIVLAVVALLSWFGGAAVTGARTHYASAAVATLLTTPAGHAAWRLIETNGDGLAANLAHCRHYPEHGREAMTCELWAQSAGGVLRHDTPFTLAWDWLNDLPVWPFLLTSLVALGALILHRNSVKAVRVR